MGDQGQLRAFGASTTVEPIWMRALPTEVQDEFWQHVDKRRPLPSVCRGARPNGLSRLPIEDK